MCSTMTSGPCMQWFVTPGRCRPPGVIDTTSSAAYRTRRSGAVEPLPGDRSIDGDGDRPLEARSVPLDEDLSAIRFRLPALAQILEAARDLADVVVALRMSTHAERFPVEFECVHRGVR